MKRSDLVAGQSYTNGNRAVRRLVAFGPEFTLYAGQAETDCCQYAIVKAGREQLFSTTAASFATWAKAALPADGVGRRGPTSTTDAGKSPGMNPNPTPEPDQ